MAEKKFIDIATNKKAFHDFEILESLEAGIELRGTEIKSVRDHAVNMKDSFVLVRDNQATLHNMHISPYGFGNIFNHEAERVRRLLLHKKEIFKLQAMISQKGVALVPLKIYIKGKYAKVQIGIAKGKKMHDKRDTIRDRDIQREVDRELKNYR